ncbi:MAG TPA: YraN family protein [Symbiobacteriaceae bacterium]|nr:YraN family protein [Symbiobacteriaceae bacterium]
MKKGVSRTARGREGEEVAARFLEGAGYRIIARNLRFRLGELDIVAADQDCVVFVEVKTRTGSGYGTAAEAVTPAKQRQLVKLASVYLAGTGSEGRPCRFDVVTVEREAGGGWRCDLIRDAFSA